MNTLMTKFSARRLAAIVFACVLFASLAAGPALAQSLNSLRASGAVGEAFDGYARARVDEGTHAAGAAVEAVEAVNAKRRAIYAKRAREQGTTAAQVGRVYANQILSGAPPGTWFLQESGRWVRK